MAALVKKVIILPAIGGMVKKKDSWEEWFNQDRFVGYYVPTYFRLVRTKGATNANLTG